MEDDSAQSRNPTCIFDELEQLQYAMIVMQNSLFAHTQEINRQIKQSTGTLVTTHRQAVAMKETLQLNLAMLERAECKVTRFSDQGTVTIIIKNFCDLMRKVEFPNITEKIIFSELLVAVRRDQEHGNDIDLDQFLFQIVDVFKQDDAPDETLQAALMAVNIPHDDYRPEPRDRNGFGGAQPQRNIRHTETATPPTMEQDSKIMGMVLKALNDLKSDMGTVTTVKKILNISDGTKTVDTAYSRQKTGYSVNEKREKTKSRFAGAIAKGPKVPKYYASPVPRPLTSRVASHWQLLKRNPDSASEQSAQFAGIQQQHKHVVPDYRILTEDHNESVLGEKCLRSFTKSLQHASAGNKTEDSGFNSRHIEHNRRANADSGFPSIIDYQ